MHLLNFSSPSIIDYSFNFQSPTHSYDECFRFVAQPNSLVRDKQLAQPRKTSHTIFDWGYRHLHNIRRVHTPIKQPYQWCFNGINHINQAHNSSLLLFIHHSYPSISMTLVICITGPSNGIWLMALITLIKMLIQCPHWNWSNSIYSSITDTYWNWSISYWYWSNKVYNSIADILLILVKQYAILSQILILVKHNIQICQCYFTDTGQTKYTVLSMIPLW